MELEKSFQGGKGEQLFQGGEGKGVLIWKKPFPGIMGNLANKGKKTIKILEDPFINVLSFREINGKRSWENFLELCTQIVRNINVMFVHHYR